MLLNLRFTLYKFFSIFAQFVLALYDFTFLLHNFRCFHFIFYLRNLRLRFTD